MPAGCLHRPRVLVLNSNWSLAPDRAPASALGTIIRGRTSPPGPGCRLHRAALIASRAVQIRAQCSRGPRVFTSVTSVRGAHLTRPRRTITSTDIPRLTSVLPNHVPVKGMAWRGSRATATRIRSRFPTTPLVGSKSTQPAPANKPDTWHEWNRHHHRPVHPGLERTGNPTRNAPRTRERTPLPPSSAPDLGRYPAHAGV